MGKKWCEYCRINVNYDKKSIQDHEATRKHQQNKEKHIKFQRIKIQKAEKAKREQQKDSLLLSTANIPKAKKGSSLEAQVSKYRQDVMNQGKMAIHQLIAERTKGLYGAPIQYPEKEELVLAENYQQKEQAEEQQGNFEMWKIDICQETGKPCFVNRITKKIVYEPPVGYVLSEEQKEEWQDVIKICMEQQEKNEEDAGIVGNWQQVEEQDDYFEKNKVEKSHEQDEKAEKEIVKKQIMEAIIPQIQEIKKQVIKEQEQQKWVQSLEEKIENNGIDSEGVFKEFMENKFKQCKNVKQQNQTLKRLVKSGFEVRATLQQEQELFKEKQQKMVGIKSRKKVKKCKLIDDNDIV